MPPFVVCVHDATPAYARETRLMIRALAPLIGRQLSCGIVPNWHGEWPLAAHSAYCQHLHDNVREVLLHGHFHQRQRGRGPISLLTGNADEMNGLDREETRRTLERGQAVFTDAFGEPARGFLPPAWQRGRVRPGHATAAGLEFVVGFFSVASGTGRDVPLATWTWDAGRWRWLGHIGHGVGWLSQSLNSGVPVLTIHPRDLQRGFWPGILRLTRQLLEAGYEPMTFGELLEVADVQART